MLRARGEALDREVAWIFVASMVVQILFWYFARVPFFAQRFPPGGAGIAQLRPVLMHWGASFLLFGAVSLAIMTIVMKKPLAEFGLRLPEGKFAWKGALATYLVFAAPIVLGGRWMPDVAAEYPMAKAAASSWGMLAVYLACYLVYYIGWEIHFRGLMLFGLAPKIGAWPAIFVQTIPSVLVHAGKPPGETFGALVAGIAWGWLALESRSILPVLLAHWAIGITNDTLMSVWFHGL